MVNREIKSVLFILRLCEVSLQIFFKKTMEKPESTVPDPRRKILNMAISSVLAEAGFDSADKECLETLSEMSQSCEYIPGVFGNFPLNFFYFFFIQYSQRSANHLGTTANCPDAQSP